MQRLPLNDVEAMRLVRESLLWGGPYSCERVNNLQVYATSNPTGVLGKPAVCVLGAFDGLHEGHRTLVASAIADARSQGVPCVAVTFEPDPAEVLFGAQPGMRILSCADRARGLLTLGVDAVLTFDFTAEEAGHSYQAFVRDELCQAVRPVSVHVGSNFSFGAGGAGTPAALAACGRELGFVVHAHTLVQEGGSTVSATRIRKLLHAGELGEANELLGRCHYVEGRVQHGRGEGTSFGFPTANVECDQRTCVPKEGVYACYLVRDGYAWPAATNVGKPPSFSHTNDPAFMEANLIGFGGDLYGAEVSVVFVQWLRASRPFDSLQELECVVRGNIEWVQANLGGGRLEVAVD